MKQKPLHFHIVTIFPDMFVSYLGESIVARAKKEKKIKVSFVNPRMFVSGKYKKVWPDGNVSRVVDDRPYGGGPGMVMMAEPVVKAVASIIKKIQKFKKTNPTLALSLSSEGKKQNDAKSPLIRGLGGFKIINFVPSAEKFTTEYAKKTVANYTDLILVCGRYEGIDARAFEILRKEYGKNIVDELSIGDYVLTGGEIPAMVLVDCMARQVPGVLGNFDSREEERVASAEVYTRPEVIVWPQSNSAKVLAGVKKYKVPNVLLNGNHKDIDEWRGKK
ncbi:MAG: tRNA (guanine(37)-N(1))-methyltransferase [Minisyncoccia bacterium]